MNNNDPMKEQREYFISIVSSIPDPGYRIVDDFATLPGEVYFDSRRWADEIFRDSANPNAPGRQIKTRYHVAAPNKKDYDLVSRTYNLQNCGIQLIECSNIISITISNYSSLCEKKETPLACISRICSLLFKINDKINFKMSGNPDNSDFFSSNISLSLNQITIWKDRIDGYLKTDKVEFIIYKCHVDIPFETNPMKWFPEEFRNVTK